MAVAFYSQKYIILQDDLQDDLNLLAIVFNTQESVSNSTIY